ncbi:MAG: response regulator transcription factor [Verrucomicrobiaceae bacterium]|nr:MAG: response regulator transcription factor [Verrucomicrobiaceae bacterium]
MPAETKKPIEVAIVEDNEALGESLQRVVESIPDARCIGVWGTAEEGLKKIDAFRPSIVLMDINLPGMSGIEATALLKRHLPEVQVIIVTVHREHEQIFDALKAGACGYLIKRSRAADVRQAILDVHSGGAPMSAEIARRVVEAFHQNAPKSEKDSETVSLSQRETSVAQLIAEGLANKEIADRLGISTETVRGHLKNIYEKLHVRSRTEAAVKYLDSVRHRNLPGG